MILDGGFGRVVCRDVRSGRVIQFSSAQYSAAAATSGGVGHGSNSQAREVDRMKERRVVAALQMLESFEATMAELTGELRELRRQLLDAVDAEDAIGMTSLARNYVHLVRRKQLLCALAKDAGMEVSH